jgi:polynucleotide 5'-kinase involved in rRNA processing
MEENQTQQPVSEKIEQKGDPIPTTKKHLPLVLIVLGMAGTGKTTFVEVSLKTKARATLQIIKI